MKNLLKRVVRRYKKLPKKVQLALPLIVVLGAGVLTFFVLNGGEEIPAQTPVVTYSTDQPDENKPGDDYEWQGGPNDPKFIRLPSIETEGYIQNVGVDQNTQVGVPDNVHIAGWFVDTVLPGEKGLSIIDGHVTGRTTDGIFIRIEQLAAGDQFSVEYGDGRLKNFEVLEVTKIEEAKSAGVLFSQNPKVSNQLNLITCGGEFNTQTNQYEDRVIVSSKLVE